MYLDKTHVFATGVAIEISTSAIRTLIEDASSGRRFAEIARIRGPEDICAHLSVIVHKGARGLVGRRRRWSGAIGKEVVAGKPVPYAAFAELFWRDIDEEDPDGDEWFRLIGGNLFAAEIMASLDKVRTVQRTLRRSTDIVTRINWALLAGDRGALDLSAS